MAKAGRPSKKKKTVKKAPIAKPELEFKLCQRCHSENPLSKRICFSCGSDKFAPPYIKKIEKVTRNTFAQVTVPRDSDEKRITLYKWWPGGNTTFNINTAEQWEQIFNIINSRLLPYLGWQTKDEIIKEISEVGEKASEKQIKKLTKSHPELIRKVLTQIDETTWEENTAADIADILKEISELLSKTDTGFRIAFMEVVKYLPKQGKRAVEDLSDLLKSWSLKVITSLSNQVIDRLQTIELFKNRVLDDKTYEIRGDDSIHRILEKAMWIIDERYWLMYSNSTLRKIVGDEVVKKNKGNESKRPDFVCGSVGDKTVIVEIKRPSHKLTIDDINQLELYLSIIEQKHDSKSIECYLIGKTIDTELRKLIKFRSSIFKIRTYTDLIEDTEKRYKEYLTITSA